MAKGKTIRNAATPTMGAHTYREGTTPGGRSYTAYKPAGAKRPLIQMEDDKKMYQKGLGPKMSAPKGKPNQAKRIRKGPTTPAKKGK